MFLGNLSTLSFDRLLLVGGKGIDVVIISIAINFWIVSFYGVCKLI
jgi:hypothetical protein